MPPARCRTEEGVITIGCNCGGGRGREVTVTSAGRSYETQEPNVKFRHWSEDKPAYSAWDGHTDYNTQAEADSAAGLLGGRVQKVDQESGRALD